MIKYVQKRDGTLQEWDPLKLTRAIGLAATRTHTPIPDIQVEHIVDNVAVKLQDTETTTVDNVHKLVENELMEHRYFDVAREYIQYRFSHMPDIFRVRESILPYEYPQVMRFVDALHDSPWNHRHFNYALDVAYYYDPNTPQLHKTIFARAQLAISQIEVAVKTYWKHIDNVFPKHEFSMMAGCFDNSEAIHFNTYKEGLERIGLVDMYDKLNQYPVLKERSESLRNAITTDTSSRKGILLKNIMFSSFIENVSLMSQFVGISAFDKFLKQYGGLSNGIRATAVEETTHFLAGVYITNIIKAENPELWTTELIDEIKSRAIASLEVEYKLIDWIFDDQDLEFLSRRDLKDYVAKRMMDSLTIIDIDLELIPRERYLEIANIFEWFDASIKSKTSVDFFASKDTAYAKGRAFTKEDAFSTEFYDMMKELNVSV